MWILLCVSMLMWALIIERLWFLRINFPVIRAQLIKEWQQRSDHDSWYAHGVRRYIECEAQLMLTAWLSTLRTLIAICPLLGLLGTVTGMIGVFEVLMLSGGDSQAMASGVYRATIPTMSALVISLSAQYFSARLRHLADRENQDFADHLTR